MAKHNSRAVVFDPPYSDALYNTLLNELPDLGRHAFLAVRMVYVQLRQISYLKDKLHSVYESGGPRPKDSLFQSYKVACHQAVNRIEEALEELRPYGYPDVFTKELPLITDLTEEERKWY
jgi:hypothetical protein